MIDYHRSEVDLAYTMTRMYNNGLETELGFKNWKDFINHVGCTVARAKEWIRTISILENAGAEPDLVRRLGMDKAIALVKRCQCILGSLDRSEQVNALLYYAEAKSLSHLRSNRMINLARDVYEGKSILPSAPVIHQQSIPNEIIKGLKRPQEERVDERKVVLGGLVSQIVRGKNRFPEKPDGFIVSDGVWSQLLFSINLEIPALILGPAGSGKTELVGVLADAMSRPLERFSFGAMSESRLSLLGSTQFSPDTGTHFVESRFAKAIKTPGTILLLDEFNRCPQETSNMLLPVLDGQRMLSIDETNSTIRLAAGVCFIATANIGQEYAGTNSIDRAVKDRFGVIIEQSYPEEAQEARLLMARQRGLSLAQARKIVTLATHQRRLAAGGEFEFGISTRMLLNTALQISFGVSMATAIEYTITNHFSPEGEDLSDRRRFRQLLQRYV
ncbi:AAA family ATPase [Pirellulaceae bacterium SH501]